MIKADIDFIWADIYKPEGFEHSKAEEFFAFEFKTLPHKEFMPKEFEEECSKLKLRFRRDNEESLFPPTGEKNIPLDGFPFFVNDTWQVIRSNKELNLPG
jgi:protein SEY1